MDNICMNGSNSEPTLEEKLHYYEKLKEYYKSLDFNKLNDRVKKILHPILLSGVKLYFNNKIKVFDEENLVVENGPCIYAFNHSNGFDFPVAASVVKKHFYILADYTMKKDLKVDMINRLNGVIYVDRKSKEDRNRAKEDLLKTLLNGNNVFIFPEGTWNLSKNLLMLPMNWGIIDIAKIANVPIIPSVIEYRNDMAYVKVGKPIKVNYDDDKKEKIYELESEMSTLKWDLINMFPCESRKDIPDNYYEKYLEETLSTYSKLDYEYESSVVLKKYVTEEEVFEPIKRLNIKKSK